MTLESIVKKIAEKEFVKTAIEERSDLSAFKQKPTLRILIGLFTIIFSYIISWPAISVLGFMSVYYKAPFIIVIGGPLLYGLSHLVFMIGMYLVGAKYSKIFLKWAARVTVEALLKKTETDFSQIL
ncbi:MAG: hypothetical protein HQK77_11805 [Desulfobacterales bacterium]|nr:hypothetical protein [Desulfobacterales bacterium]